MYQFFDPSIKPILKTSLEGNFICVYTYGLKFYGYPDFILNTHFDDFNNLFYSIIERIFKGDFAFHETWNYEGKLFKFDKINNEIVELKLVETEAVQIISILNPYSGEPLKYLSKGLKQLYGNPEIEINASIKYSKEILAYVIRESINCEEINEECSIEMENTTYQILKGFDRYGNLLFNITEQEVTMEGKMKNLISRSHLKRIK